MAIVFDAQGAPAGSGDAKASGVTTIDFNNLTVGAGSNRALVVQISFSHTLVSAVSVTWDQGGANQACALIVTVNGADLLSGRVDLWGLIAPTSGNKILRVSWTTASDVVVDAVSWTGVDQTGGATSFPNSSSATGNLTNASLAIVNAAGNAAMDCVASAGAISAPGASQTQVFLDNSPAVTGAAGSYSTSANPTFTWTIGANQWAQVGTSIKAAPPAALSTTTNSLVAGFPGVSPYLSNREEHRRELARATNRLNLAKFNCTKDVTLSANTGSTVIADIRIGYASAVTPLMALSLSAAVAIAAGIWFDSALAAASATSASIVAHHNNTADTDKKVRFGIFG